MDSFPSALSTSLTSLLSTSSAIASAQASAPAPPVTAQNTLQSSSWLGLLGYALLAMAKGVPGMLIWIITFTTITLPTVLFALFSTSLTFTMNFTTLMLIVLAFASLVSWIVRYRFLNMYARLPPEPQRKEPQIDLFPDTQDGDSKPGLANYLDEFLSAIKVFGYRDRTLCLPRTYPNDANEEAHCWGNTTFGRREGLLYGG
ncbi:hypothetical protein HO173_006767 [Letharia columbiana]|uniref:Uncharacterized protein n=1 Tax=Letharia columbiana TaxID=112416 RepID=A0A8H6FUW7_9LECA|nr:uncharacterized protein HO173_006767 [Letharia columbiana]KAF6235138.1 hypothetical protein HO173_006767 [Letharia columbiana]